MKEGGETERWKEKRGKGVEVQERLPVSVARQSSFGTFNSSQRVTMPPIIYLSL